MLGVGLALRCIPSVLYAQLRLLSRVRICTLHKLSMVLSVDGLKPSKVLSSNEHLFIHFWHIASTYSATGISINFCAFRQASYLGLLHARFSGPVYLPIADLSPRRTSSARICNSMCWCLLMIDISGKDLHLTWWNHDFPSCALRLHCSVNIVHVVLYPVTAACMDLNHSSALFKRLPIPPPRYMSQSIFDSGLYSLTYVLKTLTFFDRGNTPGCATDTPLSRVRICTSHWMTLPTINIIHTGLLAPHIIKHLDLHEGSWCASTYSATEILSLFYRLTDDQNSQGSFSCLSGSQD